MTSEEEKKKVNARSHRWRHTSQTIESKARKAEKERAWREANRARKIWLACCASSRARNQDMSLTVEQVENILAPMICSMTGLPLSWSPLGSKHPWTPTLDRIDNSRGYHLDNVRLVCWAFNKMRGIWTDEIFRQVAEAFLKEK